MRRAWTLVCGLALLAAAVGCDRPVQDECDEACARVKVLAKADFDQKTQGLPEELVREGWLAASNVIDELVGACSAACMDVGDRQLTVCLTAAADQASWKTCLQRK